MLCCRMVKEIQSLDRMYINTDFNTTEKVLNQLREAFEDIKRGDRNTFYFNVLGR